MENLGKRLKALRKSHQINQSTLSEYLGVGQSTIANYETGMRIPSPEKLKSIAEYFDVSVDFLLGNTSSTHESMTTSIEPDEIRNSLLNDLLENNEDGIYQTVENLIFHETPLITLYEEIIKPIMVEIGILWSNNQISVGQEHYVSSQISDLISKYEHDLESPSVDKTVLLMSAGNESHLIGLKMVQKIFKLHGWKTVMLGTSVPNHDLITTIEKHEVDVVALSITIHDNLNPASYITSVLRMVDSLSHLKILAGGQGIKSNQDIQLLQADYLIKDLYDLEQVITKL